jgi:1-aminocyclopropane-1-carboxylate deaminase
VNDKLRYTDTPIQEIFDPSVEKAGIRLLVKREDLNHPFISGNKWWKLKYNLADAIHSNLPVVTFGGAYSNHIYATAAACHELNIPCVGVIRGEKILPLNNTLLFAESCGMTLEFISREDYRKKETTEFIDHLKKRLGDFCLIPEGGTNELAIKGCSEFGSKLLSEHSFDHILLAAGTAGTLAGLICGFDGQKNVSGVSILKGGEFLNNTTSELVKKYSGKSYGNWSVLTSYHHGGYAKETEALTDFVRAMKDRHNLPLDTVYTGKLMWAVFKEIEERRFPRGSTVLALHTGGLQGKY